MRININKERKMRYGNPWIHKRMMEEGMRMTQARMAVLNILSRSGKHHPSAEEIFFLAHRVNPAIGFATVYRTLDLLTRMGIIQKFDFGDGKARYEMTEESKKVPHHHHLVCNSCGKVIDYTEFTDEEVTDYTVYTDKCFSCRIAFTKTMQMGNKTVTDNTDSVYFFVNIDGEWKIADIE